MVRRATFINKIRDLGFAYKRLQKRTELWRRQGGTDFIFLRTHVLLDDEYCASTLRQAGETEESIRAFIATHRVSGSC